MSHLLDGAMDYAQVLSEVRKYTATEICEKVAGFGMKEYGVYKEDISGKWIHSLPLVVGLNNSDTDKMLAVLLEKNPKGVIAGMVIAAHGLNTEQCSLYIPEERPELKERIEMACKELQVEIEICQGFIDVRQTKESVLHHVETMVALANEFFIENNIPTTIVSIAKENGFQEPKEIPFTTTVAEAIGEHKQEEIKAIEIGGQLYQPTILAHVIDQDFPLGNGMIRILNTECCMLDEAKKRLGVTRALGCGKCTFCREGLFQLYTMEKEITEGKGKIEFVNLITEIADAMKFSTLCSVGQTGADFVKGTIQQFEKEYEEHIKKKHCSVNKCSAFQSIYIDPNSCEGCEECVDVCPANCIEGKSGHIHMIDEFDCTKCGKCISACEYDAIIQTTGRVPKLPTRLTKCGKFKKR